MRGRGSHSSVVSPSGLTGDGRRISDLRRKLRQLLDLSKNAKESRRHRASMQWCGWIGSGSLVHDRLMKVQMKSGRNFYDMTR
eukprot:767474-Hanusia_phi.AAC.8